jgi:hypothetical protein
MSDMPDMTVTPFDDLSWQPVGPVDSEGNGIFVSLVYGNLESKGPIDFLMKYSAGFAAAPHWHSHDYYAVIVSGRFRHFIDAGDEGEVLTSGATWFQRGNVVHQDVCVGPEDCILSIFWPNGFDVEFVDDTTT